MHEIVGLPADDADQVANLLIYLRWTRHRVGHLGAAIFRESKARRQIEQGTCAFEKQVLLFSFHKHNASVVVTRIGEFPWECETNGRPIAANTVSARRLAHRIKEFVFMMLSRSGGSVGFFANNTRVLTVSRGRTLHRQPSGHERLPRGSRLSRAAPLWLASFS